MPSSPSSCPLGDNKSAGHEEPKQDSAKSDDGHEHEDAVAPAPSGKEGSCQGDQDDRDPTVENVQAVSRAGAGTLAELIRCEVPAILIPYPHAASDHQRANAAFFERQGGGLVVEENAMGGLQAEVMDTIFNDWLLRQFRGNLKRMDRANSLDLMLEDLEQLARTAAEARAGARRRTAA